MKIFLKTINFIINKWDNKSLDILYPYAKILLYIPHLINNILTQLFYFLIFPLTLIYVYLNEKIHFYINFLNLFVLINKKNRTLVRLK